MTSRCNGNCPSQKGMVASPRFKTRPPTLAEIIFGGGLDEFVRRFEEVNQ